MRLKTTHFRFIYAFESGHELVGVVEGDYFANSPRLVFNLRSLKAICFDPRGGLAMSFDSVFGQFSSSGAEVLFSGSHTGRGSFFSFNYRSGEACIYDSDSNTWVASGWNPRNWQLELLAPADSPPVAAVTMPPAWTTRASA